MIKKTLQHPCCGRLEKNHCSLFIPYSLAADFPAQFFGKVLVTAAVHIGDTIIHQQICFGFIE
jgi:hypothetical protein